MKVIFQMRKEIIRDYKYRTDDKYYKYPKLLMILSCIKDFVKLSIERIKVYSYSYSLITISFIIVKMEIYKTWPTNVLKCLQHCYKFWGPYEHRNSDKILRHWISQGKFFWNVCCIHKCNTALISTFPIGEIFHFWLAIE